MRGWQWRGHHCHKIGLIGGRGETQSYEIVSLSKPRERCIMSVAVAEAKYGSWAQNGEGSKMKRGDK